MMKVIIDCQPLVHGCVHLSTSTFIIKCHRLLQQKKPGIHWVFIFDKNKGRRFAESIPSENILFKKIFQNRIGWKFWFDYQLPLLVKKQEADLLITTGAVSASSDIAQVVWLPEINRHSKKGKGYFHFYKKRRMKTILGSKKIFVFSERIKHLFFQQINLDDKKAIHVKAFADENFRTFSWAEKESIKTKYAGGKEYFLVISVDRHEILIDVLKAFSQFKKISLSNMQIVFAGGRLEGSSEFIGKLNRFKYRSDVHVYDHKNEKEIAKLVSSAYGLVDVLDEDETGVNILNAFKAGIPSIISDKSNHKEIAADAALFADITDPDTLATQLILLYKDEKLRSGLLERGKLQLHQFNVDETIRQLENAISDAIKQHENNSA